MCGIVGAFLNGPGLTARVLARAALRLESRGPDDSGVWLDADGHIGFGHRRLSVIDLTPSGHQPMISPSGRYVIAFNGEIFNFRDLRDDMPPDTPWRGEGDTETLLAAIDLWGLDRAVERCVGMFAFALWDRTERRLHLVRDRFGEKPLYWCRLRSGAMHGYGFASEVKALRELPGYATEIDRAALPAYLSRGYVAGPDSIYRDTWRLPPAHRLSLDAPGGGAAPAPEPYWSAEQVALSGAGAPHRFNDMEAAADALEARLGEAVGRQMISDVPLGAFLSGGIDSSLIVAMMQRRSARPVRTFSIGYRDRAYDESGNAEAVARHLGTDHISRIVEPADALAVVDELPDIYCEPFADSSQIPTLLLARLAREHVTVALTGDAGDELFGGYNRHVLSARFWPRIERTPHILRGAAACGIRLLSPGAWDRLYAAGEFVLPRSLRMRGAGGKIHKIARVLGARDGEQLYRRLSADERGASAALGSMEEATHGWPGALHDLPSQMMLADALSYLPDDILVKVDRAAMSTSLETRIPFLDRDLYAFAAGLSPDMKIRGGVGKWLPRQVLYRHVPRELVDRPKMGFGIPVGDWLRGPLKPWAEALIDPARLHSEGFLDPAVVQRWWRAHLAGRGDHEHLLWYVLMFQLWLERWGAS